MEAEKSQTSRVGSRLETQKEPVFWPVHEGESCLTEGGLVFCSLQALS